MLQPPCLSVLGTMSSSEVRCVILADSHHAMSEGVRGLLASVFAAVVMVADEVSLIEGAKRLGSELAIVDTALPRGNILALIQRMRRGFPHMKVLVLGTSDEPLLARRVIEAGAGGYVLKRTIASDLLPAIDAILAGATYTSRAAMPLSKRPS
jgi:DNA-binding NarL/FixJ family response regulator